MVITEDIIKDALYESIDEFMLEEGEGWNRLKNSKLGQIAKNVGNSLWNGVKMYMDYRTNGQWNNKYGQYVNGNGKTTELYYLNKWFNTHLNNIKRIEYQNNTPSSDFSRNREYTIDPKTNKKVYRDTEINYDDITLYIKQNITPNNFNMWIGNFIKNRKALWFIDEYIKNIQNQINDVKTAERFLNIGNFLSDAKTGKKYMQLNNNGINNQKRQYELYNDIKSIKLFFNNLFMNSDKINKSQVEKFINDWGKKYKISSGNYEYVKNYLLWVIKNLKEDDTINKRLKYLKYDCFLRTNYGKPFV